MDLYRWIVFLHVLGSFGFMLAHGASASAAFRLRRERDLERIRALLDLSASSGIVLYVSLLVLLGAGIAAGFMGRYWGRGWIWASLAVLIALMLAMWVSGSSYYHRVRKAVGLEYMEGSKPHPPVDPASAEEIDALLASSPALFLALIGGGGLVVLVWLMMFKPF